MFFAATVLGLVSGEAVNPYCSASFPSANRYKGLVKYELVSVHLMTRHGDRAPLGESLTGSQESTGPAKGWKCSPGDISDSAVTIQGISSIKDIKFKEDGSCSKDHLTDKGIQQLARIGKELRHIYKAQLADGISVNTTWTQRTYWSAVALMSGLLDSKSPKFVIHSKPLEKDGLIHVYNKCKLEKQLSKGLAKTNEFQSANASLVKVAKNHGLGISRHSLAAYMAVDNLRCLDCHQKTLPTSNSTKSTIYKAMDEFTKALYFPTSRNAEFHRMRIGGYLKDLKQQLEDHRKKMMPRFFYTSAHDASVSALLSSLDIDITGTPPYASNFIIELWAKKGSKSGLSDVVRFIYNGEYAHPSWCNRSYCSAHGLLLNLRKLGIHLGGNPRAPREFDFWSECNAQQG